MNSRISARCCAIAALLIGTAFQTASAAQGEMGTGVPTFGIYAASLGGHVVVMGLADATINFPAGCGSLVVTPGIMGPDVYKMTVATLLAAKAAGKRVRFFAHADNGCAIDYVQLLD